MCKHELADFVWLFQLPTVESLEQERQVKRKELLKKKQKQKEKQQAQQKKIAVQRKTREVDDSFSLL